MFINTPIEAYYPGVFKDLDGKTLDGSSTIYIQADSPGKDKESNWLPAPKEPFYMLFRMYQPDIEVLNGQYQLPGVAAAK